MVPDIQPTNPSPTLGFMVVVMTVDFLPGAHRRRIMREREIRPVTVTAGGPRHFDHLVQRLLRLVVREDVGKVKVLGREV